MDSSKMDPTSSPKAPKGRPKCTSALDQSSSAETLSSFSPDGTLFVFVILSVDKHRLRIYNTASGRAIAEHTLELGRVSSLTWSTVSQVPLPQEANPPSKKRKKTTPNSVVEENGKQKDDEVVVLGLSEGSVLFYSPTQSKLMRILEHSTSTSAILSVAVGFTNKSHIWTSSADSFIRLWDIQTNSILKSWKTADRIPCSAMSVRPAGPDTRVDLLFAHHHIRLLADASTSGGSVASEPQQLAAFTGHASSVKALIWDVSATPSTRFVSTAEGDRFIYVWDISEILTNDKPVASVSLDSTVRTIAITPSDSSPANLVALSASGKLSFVPIPHALSTLSNAGGKAQKFPTLTPCSTFSSVSKGRPLDPPVIDFVVIPGNPGTLRVARLLKGTQPVFDSLSLLDDLGNHIKNLSLRDIAVMSKNEQAQSALNKRYVEPKLVGLGSGFDIDQGEEPDGTHAQQEVDGVLRLNLAEGSLGQRLTAVTESRLNTGSDSEGDDPAKASAQRTKSAKRSSRDETSMIPANSLTRTLIQALHSSDSRLLELCLSHSQPVLIRNTVRRLPPQLALPLITACVERLGRGSRAANIKASVTGASSQRGSGLLTWLKTVLAIHTGHLMTIPDLVARLSGLHATLTARLSLHENLLTLSGRLDMILSQVELRASETPAPLTSSVGKIQKGKGGGALRRYTEGDTDSDSEVKMDVEVEVDSEDEGSIEDVELGGDSENDDEEDQDLSDRDDGSLSFVDDETAEDFSEGDENESE